MVIADLAEDGKRAVVAKGGNGGFGNAHFTSSTRQAPRIAEKGEKGEELSVTLEIKMIAMSVWSVAQRRQVNASLCY